MFPMWLRNKVPSLKRPFLDAAKTTPWALSVFGVLLVNFLRRFETSTVSIMEVPESLDLVDREQKGWWMEEGAEGLVNGGASARAKVSPFCTVLSLCLIIVNAFCRNDWIQLALFVVRSPCHTSEVIQKDRGTFWPATPEPSQLLSSRPQTWRTALALSSQVVTG